jgi:hypothetical protein
MAAIGINWQDIWADVWNPVWQDATVTPPDTGCYVRYGYWQQGYAHCDFVPGAGGKKRIRRRRIVVEIDGEEFVVESVADAKTLLDLARKEAQDKAKIAQDRANAALSRPVRKVLQDARKALAEPSVVVPKELQSAADTMLDDIRALYASTLQSIELSILMRQAEREQEDDELILLLLM